MSSDETKSLPTEDKLDSLIDLVRGLTSDVKDIKSRLASLEDKVDARLHDTRPIWEAVLSRLETIEIDLDKNISVAHEVRSDLREIKRLLKEKQLV